MKIRKIKLQNIGPYRNDDNIFDLDVKKDKNIILIGGKNGAGKTTLLNSIKVGLFGTYAYGLKNGGNQYYNSLSQLFNYLEAKKKISYYEISIEFSLIENYIENIYLFSRSWKKSSENIAETLRVKKNKIYLDSEEVEEIQSKLKELIPPSVIDTMLFDGEKIAQIIDDNKISEYLKEIVHVNFNINIFEKLEDDIKYYMTKEKNRRIFSIDEINLLEYQNNYDNYQKKLKNINEVYEKYQKTLEETKFQLKILIKKFENYGGLTEREKFKMRNSLEILESTRRDNLAKVKDFLEDDVVFYLNAKRIRNIKESIEREKPLVFLRYINEISEYLGKEYTETIKNKLAENIDENLTEVKYDQSEKLKQVVDSILTRFNNDIVEAMKYTVIMTREDLDNTKLYKKIIGNNESANSIDLQKLLKNIKNLEIQLEDLKDKIKITEKEIAKSEVDLNYALLELESIQKRIDLERKEENSFNVARKIMKLSMEYREKQISHYLIKISELSVKKFSEINQKENYITKIEIDPFTYNIKIYDNNGIQKEINILSAGEKQLLISAIIWSISKLAGRNTLFTFDTPLARLDKDNRALFVENILCTISDQVMILSTDQEIIGNLLKNINKKISKKYLLKNDGNKGATEIEEGYFV